MSSANVRAAGDVGFVGTLRIERRTDDRHAVLFEELARLGGRRETTELVQFAEEGLHLSGGGEGYEHSATTVAGEGPDMRHVARGEDRVSGVEDERPIADLDVELTLEDVEPLVLVGMEVAGRAAFLVVGVLNDEELSVRLLGGDLKSHGGDTEVVGCGGTVFTGWDDACRGGQASGLIVGSERLRDGWNGKGERKGGGC